MARYSRNVTYGPRCVLDARTNSEWIPLGRTAGGMGAATNQAAKEGYRVVRNSRISARNSAPGVGTSPQDAKKVSRNLLSRLALQCRGDWIRTSDLLNPIQQVAGRKIARASRFTAYKSHTSYILRGGPHRIHRFQGVSCSFLHFMPIYTCLIRTYMHALPRIIR
jgi:hypothetical protein